MIDRECPLCQERFADPRLLSCMHTVCGRCLKDIYDVALAKQEPAKCILCSELLTNQVELAFNHSAAWCAECQLFAIHKCNTCEQIFCSDHGQQHARSKRPAHNLQPVHDDVIQKCSKHTMNDLSSFCKECNTLVCRECETDQSSLHTSHAFASVADAHIFLLDTIKTNLEKVTERCQTLTNTITQLVHLRQTLELRLNTLTVDINDFFNSLITRKRRAKTSIQPLQERRDELLKKVQTELAADMKTSELQQEGLSNILSITNLAVSQAQATVNDLEQNRSEYVSSQAAWIEHLRTASLVARRLKHVLASEPQLRLLVQDTFRFSFPEAKKIPRIAVNKLGWVGHGRNYQDIDVPVKVVDKDVVPFVYPSAVVVTSDGHLVVNDRNRGQVGFYVFTAAGELVRTVWLERVGWPSMAIAPDDELWFTSFQENCLKSFTLSGTPRQRIPCESPESVAVLSNGDILATTDFNRCVRAFNRNGEEKWRSSGDGMLVSYGIVSSPVGDEIFVCDHHNNRLQVLSAIDGRFIRYIGTTAVPQRQVPNENNAADDSDQNNEIADDDNEIEEDEVHHENTTGVIQRPCSLAITSNGLIVVSELLGHCVSVWCLNGERVHKWGSSGRKLGKFNRPRGIAALPNGRVAVVDQRNRRLQLF